MKSYRAFLVVAVFLLLPGSLLAQLCTVSGTVKLDPKDKTNGFLHYKGNLTFTAKVQLTGTNLWFVGPKYLCTCVTCPKNNWYSTGFSSNSMFQPNQSKTYFVDCGSWQLPLSGPVGKGQIQYFTGSPSQGYVDHTANCGGSFTFTQ